jgi:hypothetical protein
MRSQSSKRALLILSAATLTVALSFLLVARVSATKQGGGAAHGSGGEMLIMPGDTPPAGLVPPPKSIVPAKLPNPYCWGCKWNEQAPLEFQVDLDLLAPLGRERENAALWFRQFAPDGVRYEKEGREQIAQRRQEVVLGGDTWNVLPGNDPLLLEAEPWIDQVVCRFYPDVWKIDGWNTPIPDLLMMLDLARAWVVRGRLTDDAETATRDFRRAIRLGRLLRQDDVTIIQDLVAIAAIRIGAEALYEQAREQNDSATMLVTSMVLADKDAMRLQTAGRITTLQRGLEVDDPDAAEPSMRVTDDELDAIVELTRGLADRRFRMEGLLALQLVKRLGSAGQQTTAQEALEGLADDPDELVADFAARARDTNLTGSELADFLDNVRAK